MTTKLLSIIVPCYNAEDYMERCINSLLLGGSEIEIILVDDGSVDETPRICDYYAKTYPKMVTAVHQRNGGHGEAINTGLKHAQGDFIKIVDSDDWLDAEAFQQLLNFLRTTPKMSTKPDLIISNFIYDKQGAHHKKAMKYTHNLPENRLFTWDETHFHSGKYLLMHALIYRRTLLTKEVKLKLPKHTFYVDNLYAFEPLIKVKTLYYLDLNLYHYFIGRADQSVNESVMIKRIDQQIRVNERMVTFFRTQVDPNTELGKYMYKYVQILTTVSSILLIKAGTPLSLAKKNELWQYIAKEDHDLYHSLRRSPLGLTVHLPGYLGRKTSLGAYHIAQRIYGFN